MAFLKMSLTGKTILGLEGFYIFSRALPQHIYGCGSPGCPLWPWDAALQSWLLRVLRESLAFPRKSSLARPISDIVALGVLTPPPASTHSLIALYIHKSVQGPR